MMRFVSPSISFASNRPPHQVGSRQLNINLLNTKLQLDFQINPLVLNSQAEENLKKWLNKFEQQLQIASDQRELTFALE
jgi:hypothetical protein